MDKEFYEKQERKTMILDLEMKESELKKMILDIKMKESELKKAKELIENQTNVEFIVKKEIKKIKNESEYDDYDNPILQGIYTLSELLNAKNTKINLRPEVLELIDVKLNEFISQIVNA